MRFQGPSGVPRVAADGRPFIETVSGQSLYLQSAASDDAAHANPGFELETAGVPDSWYDFWSSGVVTVDSETVTVLSGERAARIHIAAGGGDAVYMTPPFDVLPNGDVKDFGGYIVKDNGNPRVQLGILSGASGTPVFFDEANYRNNEDTPRPVGTVWDLFTRSARVPAGHETAAIFFRISPAATEACDVVIDLTRSTVNPPDEAITPWAALPLNAGFGDVASWADAEYRRRGDDLEFRGLSAWGGGSPVAAGSVLTSAPLDEEFRPAYNKVVADSYIPTPPAVAAVGTTVYVRPDGHIVTTAALPVNATLNFDGKRIDLTL